MVSSRNLVILLAFFIAISASSVPASAEVTWDDWYSYGWYNASSYEDWSAKYDDKEDKGYYHGNDTWGWGWGWPWGGHSDYDGECWWWWGCPANEHYASVYGKVKDDKNRPVKGAKLLVDCYHRLWDGKAKKWGVDKKFYSYPCVTDSYGVYSYGRIPTKEHSYSKYKAHFSYCKVKPDKTPARYTYHSVDKKDHKIGYWYTNPKDKKKYWKHDLSDKKRYNGPVYTYKWY